MSLGISCLTHVSSESVDFDFPAGVKEFEYIITNYYSWDFEGEDDDFGFSYTENIKYEITDVDGENNYFHIKNTDTCNLINVYGDVAITAIEAQLEDGTTERYTFSIEEDFTIVVNRRAELTTGTILSHLDEKKPAIYYWIVFEVFETEYSKLLTSYASVGYVPFPWNRIYQPESYSPFDTVFLTTPAGKFECYSVESGDNNFFYDTETNFCVQLQYDFISEYDLLDTSTATLSSIVYGRSWDKINVDLSISDDRIDIGNHPTLNYTGVYDYDSTPFSGEIQLTTCDVTEVGNHTYTVKSVLDPIYGITEFESNEVICIFDRVDVDLSLQDNHIDVDEEPNISTEATYAYDSVPLDGEVTISTPDIAGVGAFTYKVEEVSDLLYGLTEFEGNEVTCIWDRVKIVDGNVSRSVAETDESVTLWFKAVYEYDDEVFSGSRGILYVNGDPAQWSESNERWELVCTSDEATIRTFEISRIKDEKYGLTSFDDVVGKQTIEWKRPGIPGFPVESILLGLALGVFVIWTMLRFRQ